MTFSTHPKMVTEPGGGLRRPRRLAIVGSHPKGLENVPWEDPNIEIWLFNEAPLRESKYPRWDACLQIHGKEVYASDHNWVNSDYWKWLQEPHGKPIYMQDVDPRVPDSVKYPLEEILALTPYHYLRSSPAMALALAIYLGYDEIQLYGSELTSNTEYAYQSTNYAFWIGFAHGCGVDLKLNCWHDEFFQKIYGYEGELQIDKSFYLSRLAGYVDVCRGNEKAMRRFREKMDQAMLESKFDAVAGLLIDIENAALAAGETEGQRREAERYSLRENMISRQEFEKAAARAQQDGDQARSDKDHEGGKCEYVWNVWKATGSLEALNQLRTFLNAKIDYAYDTGLQFGIFSENMKYLSEYDERLRAAGGVRAFGRNP